MSSFRNMNKTKLVFHEEDYPFLEACWAMCLDLNRSGDGLILPAAFGPILDNDGSCSEVSIRWSQNNSTLLISLGKETTISHQETSGESPLTVPASLNYIKAKVKQRCGMDTNIAAKLIAVTEWMENSGYRGLYIPNGNYPIPIMLYDKPDSVVGAVSVLEYTTNPQVGQTDIFH